MQSTDLQVIKDIPGYKVILKAVLKSQIQQLVEQLADHTGEESVILTASVSDGSLSHLGSDAGKVFLEDHDDIKSQFLGFCLKHHHKQKQLEKEKQQQLQDPGGQMLMAPTTPTRFGPGPRPRFSPTRVHTSPRHISPQSQSPRAIHPVSLTRASPQSIPRGGASNVRHEPYPGARPRKPLRFDPLSHKRLSQPSSSMILPTEPGSAQKVNNPNEVIKIEPMDEDEKNAEKSSAGSGKEDSGTEPPATAESASPSHTPMPPTPTDSSQSPAMKDDGSESSSSTIINEPTEVKYSDTLPPGGLSLNSDLSNLTGQMDSSTSDSASVDPNVNIKVEAITESDLDLEITGIEPGQMAQPDYGLMPNLQTRMGYDPSSSGGAQGDLAGESSQGYKPVDIGAVQKYACRYCNKLCRDSWILKRHERIHSGEKPYSCETCGEIFLEKENLIIHERIHIGDKPYSCEICEKSFLVKYSLIAHKRSHSGDKPYNCVICGKAFTKKGNLIIHERIHTGDKPYTCGICGKSFAGKRHLTRHARSHIGEKPYGCEMCGRSFKTKEGHKSHQFKCPILHFQ